MKTKVKVSHDNNKAAPIPQAQTVSNLVRKAADKEARALEAIRGYIDTCRKLRSKRFGEKLIKSLILMDAKKSRRLANIYSDWTQQLNRRADILESPKALFIKTLDVDDPFWKRQGAHYWDVPKALSNAAYLELMASRLRSAVANYQEHGGITAN